MKITWNNIDDFKLTRSGSNFVSKYKPGSLSLIANCKICKDPFFILNGNLSKSNNSGKYCSKSCAAKLNNFYNKKGKLSHNYGKKYSEEHRSKIGLAHKGRKLSKEHCQKISTRMTGSNSPSWKGGKYIALYDTHHLDLENEAIGCRRNKKDISVLEVTCYKCKNWFKPTRRQVVNKRTSIRTDKDANNLYCSDECKKSCNVFNKSEINYIAEQKRIIFGEKVKRLSVEQKAFREGLIAVSDDTVCSICGSELEVQAHHIIPISKCITTSDIMGWDLTNGLLLCFDCHKMVHKLDGCTSQDLIY